MPPDPALTLALSTHAPSLSSAEVETLRRTLGSDSALAQVVVIGGQRLQDLATELGPAALADTVNALTPARFAGLAQSGGTTVLTGVQLRALATSLTDAQLTRLETVMTSAQLAAFFDAQEMGASGLLLIHRVATHARIHGIRDWVHFEAVTSGHGPVDWGRSRAELNEALRLADEHPGSIISIAGDASPPMRSGGRPGRRAPTFDITVLDAVTGAVQRGVETTTVDKPVARAAQLVDGVRHAGGKALDRSTNPVDLPSGPTGVIHPIPGTGADGLDAVIRVDLLHGELPLGRGATPIPASGVPVGTRPTRTLPSGVVFDGFGGYELQTHIAYTGVTETPANWEGRTNPGDILVDFLDVLNSGQPIAGSTLLKRIRLVRLDGSLVAEFEGTGVPGGWQRVR